MYKKRLFKKKKNYYKYYLTSFVFAFLIIYSFWHLFFIKSDLYNIPPNKISFYFFPLDKGGKIIANQDKKGLHLSYNSKKYINLNNNIDINYSIQIYTNDNFDKFMKKRGDFLRKNINLFTSKDLFVTILETNIGYEYFLLFKNFETRNIASQYCQKHSYLLDKCVIVNVQNFN